jgi:hypothetical protein
VAEVGARVASRASRAEPATSAPEQAVSDHEPCVVVMDFTDDVPQATFCIPDDPPVSEEPSAGLFFNEPSNSGLIGVL